jgi:hypothetical protein
MVRIVVRSLQKYCLFEKEVPFIGIIYVQFLWMIVQT